MVENTAVDIDSQNIIKFAASVGDKIKICAPSHHLPAPKPTDIPEDRYLNGFILFDRYIGAFEGSSGRCIFYRHNKSGLQVIKYISTGLGDVEFYAVVEGITVHSHASVYQGGPAYATYYAEVEEGT